MTNGLRYLLIAIVITFLVILNMAGGVGFILAFPLYYALYKLFTMETTK